MFKKIMIASCIAILPAANISITNRVDRINECREFMKLDEQVGIMDVMLSETEDELYTVAKRLEQETGKKYNISSEPANTYKHRFYTAYNNYRLHVCGTKSDASFSFKK